MVVLIYFLVLVNDGISESISPILSRKDMLTGGSHQSWQIYSITPDQRCKSSTDDSWIFFADGTFEFDHGSITENETNKCSDLVNIVGKWELLDNESTLKVVAAHEKGNTENTFTTILIEGKITELNNEKLLINIFDATSQRHYAYEFRKK